MSELKATPGAWEPRHDELVAANGNTVAVFVCCGSQEVNAANAHLIAAAPELYKALKILMVSYESLSHDYQYAVGAGDIHPIHAEYIQGSADALAKARGEQ